MNEQELKELIQSIVQESLGDDMKDYLREQMAESLKKLLVDKTKYITYRQLADYYEGTFSYSSIRRWGSRGEFRTYDITKKKQITTIKDFEEFIYSKKEEPITSKIGKIKR